MKTLGYYNGKIDELDKITVPMLDRASYFGDGVYDVTFSRNYKIYKLREHVERIFASAALLKIFPEITPDELCEIVKATITSDGFVFNGVTGSMTWDVSGAATKAPIIIELGK